MLRDERKRQKLIADRERRTTNQLFSVEIFNDVAGDPMTNQALLNGYADQVDDGLPATFGTWRPPAVRVRPFGRQRRATRVRYEYTPIVTPVLALAFDVSDLISRSLRWTWQALDGSR